MPKANPYRRPRLKNLALSLVMLLAKDLAIENTPMQNSLINAATAQPIPTSLPDLQHRLSDTNPTLTATELLCASQPSKEAETGEAIAIPKANHAGVASKARKKTDPYSEIIESLQILFLLVITISITEFVAFRLLRNGNPIGINPNALFNQPNLGEHHAHTTRVKPR